MKPEAESNQESKQRLGDGDPLRGDPLSWGYRLSGWVRKEVATWGLELEEHGVETRLREAGEDLGEGPR